MVEDADRRTPASASPLASSVRPFRIAGAFGRDRAGLDVLGVVERSAPVGNRGAAAGVLRRHLGVGCAPASPWPWAWPWPSRWPSPSRSQWPSRWRSPWGPRPGRPSARAPAPAPALEPAADGPVGDLEHLRQRAAVVGLAALLDLLRRVGADGDPVAPGRDHLRERDREGDLLRPVLRGRRPTFLRASGARIPAGPPSGGSAAPAPFPRLRTVTRSFTSPPARAQPTGSPSSRRGRGGSACRRRRPARPASAPANAEQVFHGVRARHPCGVLLGLGLRRNLGSPKRRGSHIGLIPVRASARLADPSGPGAEAAEIVRSAQVQRSLRVDVGRVGLDVAELERRSERPLVLRLAEDRRPRAGGGAPRQRAVVVPARQRAARRAHRRRKLRSASGTVGADRRRRPLDRRRQADVAVDEPADVARDAARPQVVDVALTVRSASAISSSGGSTQPSHVRIPAASRSDRSSGVHRPHESGAPSTHQRHVADRDHRRLVAAAFWGWRACPSRSSRTSPSG